MTAIESKRLRVEFEHRGSGWKVSLEGSAQAVSEFFLELLPPITVVLLTARLLLAWDGFNMEGMGKPPSPNSICPTMEAPYKTMPRHELDRDRDN
jgi:hypothetical protein